MCYFITADNKFYEEAGRRLPIKPYYPLAIKGTKLQFYLRLTKKWRKIYRFRVANHLPSTYRPVAFFLKNRCGTHPYFPITK